MLDSVTQGFVALGLAALFFGGGVFFALRGESMTSAVLIVLGAVLTFASMATSG